MAYIMTDSKLICWACSFLFVSSVHSCLDVNEVSMRCSAINLLTLVGNETHQLDSYHVLKLVFDPRLV